MADAKVAITNEMTSAVTSAISNPSVKAELSAVPAIIAALTPVIDNILHSTNNEPWYQSRITWGSILTLVAVILGAFRIAFPAELQNAILDAILTIGIPTVGALIALIGRWKSKKPIGS